jgi:hypothetical protein
LFPQDEDGYDDEYYSDEDSEPRSKKRRADGEVRNLVIFFL